MKAIALLLSLLIYLHLVLSEDNDNEIILSTILEGFKIYSHIQEDSGEDKIDLTSTPQVWI